MATISAFVASNDIPLIWSFVHSFTHIKSFGWNLNFSTPPRHGGQNLQSIGISSNFLRWIMTDSVPSQLRKHMMHSAVMSTFWGVFASQTASWLVSGAETSTTRSFFVLSIDWCRFHCDPLSNEWGDTSSRTTYITTYTHTHTHPKFSIADHHRVSWTRAFGARHST